MIAITIIEETEDYGEMAALLRKIADRIDAGDMRGISPQWEIDGYPEPEYRMQIAEAAKEVSAALTDHHLTHQIRQAFC